ncbi:dinucleotide-utilizing enzyme [Microbacterium sp. Marseille-Q6965]|uniref:dinucleotide-utilizing enzyme n=1 Tax=Microbacterium sp. Marseille-Q6965 TaxID=2965072 RepID=UPI0021B7B2DE|nr:dinucleotide-utilizing enzyme [Microbacterium sp. Marseille-Q6965]
MPRTPRLITSAPYWALLIGSLAATAAGAAMSFPTIDNMSATLLDGSATTADVYAGQALVTVGGPVLGAGLIGLALAAAVAAARALLRPRAAEPREEAAVAALAEGPAVADEKPAAADEVAEGSPLAAGDAPRAATLVGSSPSETTPPRP